MNVYQTENPRIDPLFTGLSGKTASIVGLGGGGEIALHLLRSGIDRMHLFDFDILEAGNLVRHICGSEYVGQNKAEAVASLLRKYAGNDGSAILAHPYDIFQHREGFEGLAKSSDIVIVATDTDASRYFTGEICNENGTPAVFASMFDQGCGGEIFASVPGKACYGCFARHLGRKAFIESYAATRNKADCSSARDTKSMPGLGIDQSFLSAIAARKALDILLSGSECSLPDIGPNWIVFSVSGIPEIVENPLSSLAMELQVHPDCDCSRFRMA